MAMTPAQRADFASVARFKDRAHLRHVIKSLEPTLKNYSHMPMGDLMGLLIDHGGKNETYFIEAVIHQIDLYYLERGSSTAWYPLATPLFTDAADLNARLQRQLGRDPREPRYDADANRPYLLSARNGWMNRQFNMHYIVPYTRHLPTADGGSVPDKGRRNTYVIVRPNGVEIRCSDNLRDTVRAAFVTTMQNAGITVPACEPQWIENRTQLYGLLEKLSETSPDCETLFDYKCKGNPEDEFGYQSHAGKEMGLRTPRPKRELRILAERDAGIAATLSRDMAVAAMDFDFSHPDGYLERRVGVELTPNSVKLAGGSSEAAIEHFWGAFDAARRL